MIKQVDPSLNSKIQAASGGEEDEEDEENDADDDVEVELGFGEKLLSSMAYKQEVYQNEMLKIASIQSNCKRWKRTIWFY